MSPEMNPPNVTKRSKKKSPANLKQNFDLNLPSCNYFPMTPYPSYSNVINGYYPFLSCPNPAEPMSLPVYPCSLMSRQPSAVLDQTYLEGIDYSSLQMDLPAEADGEDPKRRFSDPGLPNDSESSSNCSEDASLHKLKQQIAWLRDSNARLSREVMEMRVELNFLKQQQTNRHYEPGLLADLIREVRDAARIREDALLSRVKHVMEEKQLSVSQLSLAMEKDKNTDRIAKLEEQLRNLTVNGNSRSDNCTATSLNSSTVIPDEKLQSARQVLDLERETLELRRELQDTRNKKDEAEQKMLRLSNMLRRSEPPEDGLLRSADSLSTLTTSSVGQQPRVVLSGPVTSL